MIPLSTILSRWFDAHRGTGLGLAAAGSGVAAAFLLRASTGPGFSHLTVLYQQAGLSPAYTSFLISYLSLMLIVGKILYGYLSDQLGEYRAHMLAFLLSQMETVFYTFCTYLPIHLLAYLPFLDILRFGKRWMALTVAGNMAIHMLGAAWVISMGRPDLVMLVGELKQVLDQTVQKNSFYMVKVAGHFETIQVRSEYAQQKPYLDLAVDLSEAIQQVETNA